jgi:hypothetical protein
VLEFEVKRVAMTKVSDYGGQLQRSQACASFCSKRFVVSSWAKQVCTF